MEPWIRQYNGELSGFEKSFYLSFSATISTYLRKIRTDPLWLSLLLLLVATDILIGYRVNAIIIT